VIRLSPPDPPLDDGVVRLRALRADDAAPYAAAFRDDTELGLLAGVPEDPDEDAARRRILETGPEHAARGSAIELAIAASEDDRFLGAALLWHVDWEALRGEIGMWMAAGDRSSGVGSRALALLVEWAFDAYGLHRIHLETFPENAAARRVAEHVGFVHEGVLREHAVERGRRVSIAVYGLLAREWAARQRTT